MRRALFLTAVAPDRFSRQASGIQRRFELLATGLATVCDAIDFVVMVDTADPAELRVRADQAGRQLAMRIGIEQTVTLLPVAPLPPHEGFVRHNFTSSLSFDRLPGYRRYLGPRQLESLRTCLEERRPALVLSQRLATVAMLARIGRDAALPPVFFDLDDLEHVAHRRLVEEPPMWRSKRLRYLQVPALIAEERRAIRLARRTFVCSDLDRRKLARLAMNERVAVLPNAIDIPGEAALPAREPTLLFLGIFSYAPNRAAAEHFLDNVWPRVRARVPSARAVFAGAYPERVRHYRAPPPGIVFPGYVDVLEKLYLDTRVVVSPIRSGGGTRVKIIEAAAHARPVVSTALGAEGLTFENGTEILLRDRNEEFAEACIELLGDYDACVSLGRAAHARACREYRRETVAGELAALIRSSTDAGEP
jgi:glycosyltransferase involved in cell wall biosynthesis